MIVRKKLFLTDACYLACSNGWEVNYYGSQTTDGDRCYNRADNFDICIEGKSLFYVSLSQVVLNLSSEIAF